MTIKDIMDRVSLLYNDVDYVRVSKSMYLKFLDDALMQLVSARPDAHSKIVVTQLVPGTRQTFPADLLTLIEIYRNRGQDGLTSGQPIWKVNRKDMDYFSNWHATSVTEPTAITEYVYDARDQKVYWVSPAPGQTTPIYIEMSYSYAFTPFAGTVWETALLATLPCDESFANAVISYMLYRLYSTDTASKTDKVLADSYKADFFSLLGIEATASSAVTTTVGDTPINTTTTAAN